MTQHHKTAVEKANQYKINMARVILIESSPTGRSWNIHGESPQNHLVERQLNADRVIQPLAQSHGNFRDG